MINTRTHATEHHSPVLKRSCVGIEYIDRAPGRIASVAFGEIFSNTGDQVLLK